MAKYSEEGVKTLEILSEAGSYNSWIYDQIKDHVGQNILEVGCGIGNMTCFFKDREKILGIDIDREIVKNVKKRFEKYPNIKIQCSDINKISGKGAYDTIICLNVLEHIDEDQKTLNKMWKLLKKGGKLIIVVPALSKLYNGLDKNLLHFRRYNKSELGSKVKKEGFSIIRLHYMNLPGILGWFVNGKILGRTILPVNQVLLYDKCVGVISMIERVIPPPVGLSLILVAEK